MIIRRNGATSDQNVRMGPLAIFTLMAVISLAVMAVLAISTAQATVTMAQRRAEATTQLYADESAAQAFVAALDSQRGRRFTQAKVDAAVQTALESAPADAVEQLSIEAQLENRRTVTASFSCGNGRQLDITLHRENDGSLSIQRWRMMAVVNEEPTIGNLFGGF